MGDVVGITDSSGAQVATYSYSPWGEVLAVTPATPGNTTQLAIANDNPLRYRGYYYDAETSYYYLQSRYYDPGICRFLNADVLDITYVTKTNYAGENLFVYCGNNPTNTSDPTGSISISTIIGAILGFGAAYLLLPVLADYYGYKGNKRKWFVGLGTAAATVAGGLLGRYAGKAIARIYSMGLRYSRVLNKALTKAIARIVKGSVKSTSGDGLAIQFKAKNARYLLRVMNRGGGRTNYFRLSHAKKGAMDIAGRFSNSRSATHIPITLNNIIKLINTMLRLKR